MYAAYSNQAKNMVKQAKSMIKQGKYILHMIESGRAMLPSLSEEVESQFLGDFPEQLRDIIKVGCADNCTTTRTLNKHDFEI